MNKLATRQVHLDFHTPTLPFELGKNFEKEQFQKNLLQAEINGITLTGRCHHGYIYYETKLAAKHPQMKKDFLMEQIDACHEIGIKAPIYLTVGWDAYSADRHPEWLERKPNGEMYGFEDYGQLAPGWKTLCFNTPYLEYLKTQIIDTMNHFGEKLDGLFFDIVWQDPCCCNDCINKMLSKGYNPEKEIDRVAFSKETEQYLKHEIYETIHEINADCPIFFNEGNILPSIRPNLNEYSHLEIESLPSGNWGYQHFPTAVRYAKNLGKEYLGMTGKFHKVWADFGSYKNQAALEYEMFLAVAHGAKCSIGDQMYPDGTLQTATYELIGNVYSQVKEIEKYNLGGQAVTEIGILHPGIVKESTEKVDLSLAGAVNILNEAHYQFDIIDQFMDWSSYKVIVLPDEFFLNDNLANQLSDYLSNGGKVLATYHSGITRNHDFLKEWGIHFAGENEENPIYGYFEKEQFPTIPKGELVLHGPSLQINMENAVSIGSEAKPLFSRTYRHYYSHFQAPVGLKTGLPVATKTSNVVYFTVPLFEMYKNQGVKAYKDLVLHGIESLLDGEKFVQTQLPSTADVILNHDKINQRLVLNLLHYIPERRSLTIDTIEDKIPLYKQRIDMDIEAVFNQCKISEKEISSINSVREQNEVLFEILENKLSFEVPLINGYELVVINYK